MTFGPLTYVNLVNETTRGQERLFLQYIGPRNDFDIVIVGSGIGGGILADDIGERLGKNRRILVLEAGSFVYPTHVYNICRFPNASVARHFGCDTFWQGGTSADQFFIGEKPQLAFGGRSIFWSGLIPSIQPWELEFFPARVKQRPRERPARRGRRPDERIALDGIDRARSARYLARQPARPALHHRRNAACPAPAVSRARRHTARAVLQRADRRLQHRRSCSSTRSA